MRGVLFLLPALVSVAAAQATTSRTRVLLITGLSAEPRFARIFSEAADRIYDAAKLRWKVADSDLTYLAENPAADPTRVRAVASREEVQRAFSRLAAQVRSGDVVLVVLIGHGAGEQAESKVNLRGPDPTAADYAIWLDALKSATVVFINASSGSGDFLPVISARNRITITATKSAMERNESLFATRLALGLTSDSADADKDGRNSVFEAFTFATKQVERAYSDAGKLQTEHAQLDDTGDGVGTADPAAPDATDGALARQVSFGPGTAVTDPRVIALIQERRALELQVAELRGRKATTDSTAYQQQLERLLLAIAEKSEAIRRLQRAAR